MEWDYHRLDLWAREISGGESTIQIFEHHPIYTTHRMIVLGHDERRKIESLSAISKTELVSIAHICIMGSNEWSRLTPDLHQAVCKKEAWRVLGTDTQHIGKFGTIQLSHNANGTSLRW